MGEGITDVSWDGGWTITTASTTTIYSSFSIILNAVVVARIFIFILFTSITRATTVYSCLSLVLNRVRTGRSWSIIIVIVGSIGV